MATPITNQKSSSIKYKFGDDELDLNDYIRNLNHNYQSYVNSQNWNEGQRQEFRAAYENFLGGLRDQLANNTNRFSTDFSGSLIDSTGQLSNTDNDDIDPVGSEYYYDNNGNKITTDDFNTMKKRQQKKYNTFSANRQVATFFNKVGTALRDARRNKPAVQEKPNRFDLSRHGFLANWTTMNNPAGGQLNLDPYLEKDSLDETTGQRGTTNRANYLKEQIENYINNIEDLDFSASPFKDRDTYISRLRAAADNLGNGYNSEDVIALNQAGIGNEFLGKFFATGAKSSDVLGQAQEVIQQQQEEEQKQQAQKIIEENKQRKLEDEANAYFDSYLHSNPFKAQYYGLAEGKLDESALETLLRKKYNTDYLTEDMYNDYIKGNLPKVLDYITGKAVLDTPRRTVSQEDTEKWHKQNKELIASTLQAAIAQGLMKESYQGSGEYVIPGSEDNYTYIGYNPSTNSYEQKSMLLNDQLRKAMAYDFYRKVQKNEQGGVLPILQSGGGLAARANARLQQSKKPTQQKQEPTKAIDNTKSKEEVQAGQRKLSDGLSGTDIARLAAIGLDLTSAISSFVPGAGTIASGVTGVGSTLTTLGADIAEDGFQLSDLGNAAVGLGMDVVGLLPGFGTAGKAAKIGKQLIRFAPVILGGLQAYNALNESSRASWQKVMDRKFSDLTVDDLRNIAAGITAFTSLSNQAGIRMKNSAMKSVARTGDYQIESKAGEMLRVSPEKLEAIKGAKSLKEANQVLQSIEGYKNKELPSRFRSSVNPSRIWNHNPKVSEHYDFDKLKGTTLDRGSYGLPSDAQVFQSVRSNNLGLSWHLNIKNPYTKSLSKKNTPKKVNNPQQNYDRLRELSSQTGKLTSQEIATINRQRVKSGKGKLTAQEIEQLNQRRARRAETTDVRMTSADWRATPYRYGQWEKLREYKKAKREGKFNSVEDDIKRAQDELAESVRQQRLAVPTGQGQIISPDAKQVRTIVGLSKAIPTVTPSRPTTQSSANLPAVIPKQQIRLEQSPQLNMQRVREGVARAERERLGRDIGNTRIQRAIETNPERTARLQAQDAQRNVRDAVNTYSIPQYKRPLSGAAYNAKQNMYNQLFNQRRYDVLEAFRRRELPHKQSNRKKKTSRDDRVTRKEEGGTIDLVKVRKFQNAGKFPDWYSGLYKFSKLKNWSDQLDYSKAGPSITNENAGHFRAGDLGEAFNKNNAYISNPNLISSDLQSYYTSSFNGKPLDDFISQYNSNATKIRGYWDQERAYRESGASGHNQLFRNMFKNRSNDADNAWNIGYDPNLEDTVGSSTWLRRMDRYEKEFDSLGEEERKARIHKIDLGDGNFGYVYKKANGDIARWDNPVEQQDSALQVSQNKSAATNPIVDQPAPTSTKKGIGSFLSSLSPTITHGLPRALYADRMNRKITDLAKESITPLLKDPFEVHRYTRSDLDAEMQGERNYANLRRLASRPITSDGSLQTAMQLQAEVQGQEARTLGKEKSNQVQRQYDEAAWQQEKENAANRHETAMFNRAQQWGAEQDKSKFEQAYLSKKFNIWDVVGQQLEYDERVKQQERKGLSDNFARSDIHDAVMYTPNEYGAQLTPEELAAWNKVITGTNPSTLGSELNIYTQAMKKVQRAETQQLRKYYKVPDTQWQIDTKFPKTDSISIRPQTMEKGGKVEVAGIEAKTADAERFQKQIKETIDRNEKAIERLSKSLHGIIKASMIK